MADQQGYLEKFITEANNKIDYIEKNHFNIKDTINTIIPDEKITGRMEDDVSQEQKCSVMLTIHRLAQILGRLDSLINKSEDIVNQIIKL